MAFFCEDGLILWGPPHFVRPDLIFWGHTLFCEAVNLWGWLHPHFLAFTSLFSMFSIHPFHSSKKARTTTSIHTLLIYQDLETTQQGYTGYAKFIVPKGVQEKQASTFIDFWWKWRGNKDNGFWVRNLHKLFTWNQCHLCGRCGSSWSLLSPLICPEGQISLCVSFCNPSGSSILGPVNCLLAPESSFPHHKSLAPPHPPSPSTWCFPLHSPNNISRETVCNHNHITH